MYFSVGAWPGRSAMSTSASCDPTLSVCTKARLYEIGIPIIALTVCRSRDGMISRRRCSSRATVRSVSSRRVPTGARKCSRIWPASTLGKKSSPTTNGSATLQAAISAADVNTTPR